ncbi:MAG: NAD(P)-dependent oxidoreductase [Chloroflexi bacterium]|nr:NAD(P)-dependent oxidoreductase [Chloroflexota bacterium]
MKNNIFVAGASGVVGRRLCVLLVKDGWSVTGTTRSPEKEFDLRVLGIRPVVIDVFDENKLHKVVADAQPDIVIHQLTDLPDALEPSKMPDALVRNATIRDIGTRNLIAASVAAGVKRMIAQSISFVYEMGPMPYTEDSPIKNANGVVSLEHQVLHAPFEGIVLRYGKFYGPGTGFDNPPVGGPVHVDAAAHAARLAVTRGSPGIYNIAEEDGTVSSQKALRDLGWNPNFRLSQE